MAGLLAAVILAITLSPSERVPPPRVPPYLLEKPDPAREVIGLSWLVSHRLLYLFALADTRGRRTRAMARPEDAVHLWKAAAEEAGYRRLARDGRVDGVFLVDLRQADPRIALLEEIGLPAVTLNRPDAANAQSSKLLDELDRALDLADADDDVRAAIGLGQLEKLDAILAGRARVAARVESSRASAGFSVICSTYAANTAGSRPSTRKPVRPWSTSVRSPPTAAATTGVPQAAASSPTRPNDSLRLGTITRSAAR